MDDVWRRGLLTETHATSHRRSCRRLPARRWRATSSPPIRNSTKRGTEGVLLAVNDGAVTSQALRIDARSGAMKAVGPALLCTQARRRCVRRPPPPCR